MKKILITLLCIISLFTNISSKIKANETTKMIQTKRGEVSIPKQANRIADLAGISDILYILGNYPVATANSDAFNYKKLPEYLKEELQNTIVVGYYLTEDINIERIIESKPDLIIINSHQEKYLEQLKQIAPTIIIEPKVNDWVSNLNMVANIIDKQEEAAEFLYKYNKKSNEISKKIKEINGEDTIYFSFLTEKNKYYLFSKASYGDILYNDLGLKAPNNLPKEDSITLPFTDVIGLSKINADILIVLASPEDKKILEESDIWNNIQAVKNNKVIWLDHSPYFNQGYSLYGRFKLLDDLDDLLTKK